MSVRIDIINKTGEDLPIHMGGRMIGTLESFSESKRFLIMDSDVQYSIKISIGHIAFIIAKKNGEISQIGVQSDYMNQVSGICTDDLEDSGFPPGGDIAFEINSPGSGNTVNWPVSDIYCTMCA